MNWKMVVISTSIAVYLYLLITEWVNLAPWNDISVSTPSQKLSGSLVNLVPFAVLIAAFLFDLRWLKILTVGLFVLWIGVHFVWWWVPYLWGASEAHMESYNRFFSHEFKFLPPRGSYPIPTAHYVIMQFLVLLNSVIAIIALLAKQQ